MQTRRMKKKKTKLSNDVLGEALAVGSTLKKFIQENCKIDLIIVNKTDSKRSIVTCELYFYKSNQIKAYRKGLLHVFLFKTELKRVQFILN